MSRRRLGRLWKLIRFRGNLVALLIVPLRDGEQQAPSFVAFRARNYVAKGTAKMGRILTIIGLTYAICALVELSPNPDAWSGMARAFLLVISASVIGMNAEVVLQHGLANRRPRFRGLRPSGRSLHPAG